MFDASLLSGAPWPHQHRGLVHIWREIDAGDYSKLVLCSPTGGGKTYMAQELIYEAHRRNWKSAFYTHRKPLLRQTSNAFKKAGIEHAFRASGRPEDFYEPVQLCMTQTERSRVLDMEVRPVHNCQLVLIDEIHACLGPGLRELIQMHVDDGAVVVGLTATAVNLGGVFDHIVQAGVNSELRQCGALLPCYTIGPDEPDMSKLTPGQNGDYSEQQISKAMYGKGYDAKAKTLFGSIVSHYRGINPNQDPAMLFAPGVPESIWIAGQFTKAGIPAAHIGGDTIWIKGKEYKSDDDNREEVERMAESGEIKVVCNRFVLREGISWNFIRHGIAATVFGALSSFVQAGGRILRAHPGMKTVLWQDHGGAWWRHGSLNDDREYTLNDTNKSLAKKRKEKMQTGEIEEPVRCGNCGAIMKFKASCPSCQKEYDKEVKCCGRQIRCEVECWKCGPKKIVKRSVRCVIEANGKLKKMHGRAVKRKKVSHLIQAEWDSCYWRCFKTGRKFSQVKGLFETENAKHGWELWWRKTPTGPKWAIKVDVDKFFILGNCPTADGDEPREKWKAFTKDVLRDRMQFPSALERQENNDIDQYVREVLAASV